MSGNITSNRSLSSYKLEVEVEDVNHNNNVSQTLIGSCDDLVTPLTFSYLIVGEAVSCATFTYVFLKTSLFKFFMSF